MHKSKALRITTYTDTASKKQLHVIYVDGNYQAVIDLEKKFPTARKGADAEPKPLSYVVIEGGSVVMIDPNETQTP